MISWQLASKREDLIRVESEPPALPEGWSRVRVAGCGLCHTDLGFIFSDLPTRRALPLTLGHEISGTVVEGPLAGAQVVVPAVMPCGECPACLAGQERVCPKQLMPGNDIHGGFAELIDVPARFLATIPVTQSPEALARLSVVADAVTTPLQAIHNLGLQAGELAVVIGCGGVGGYAALIALARGARVVCLDIDARKLEKLAAAGVEHTLNTGGMDAAAVKDWLKDLVKATGAPRFGHKILECSGSRAGQELAFALLGFGARVAIVGYTMEKVSVRLSNLMAFDAALVGNWGASPSLYPEAIALALDGSLRLEEFTELFPLSEINAVIRRAHGEGLLRRAVLVP